MAEPEWRFRGFLSPTYTQVPDEFFDEVAPRLSEAELRVALYVIRRTFGFKKQEDAISLNQMINGIKAKDGRVLDHGTGLSRAGVIKGVKGLVQKRVLLVAKQVAPDGGDLANVYRLNVLEPGGVYDVAPRSLPRRPQVGVRVVAPPSLPGRLPGGDTVDPQETVEQETANQERDPSNDSNGPDVVMAKEDAERIAWIVRDLARELHDQAPLKSTATRACRLYAQSGLGLDEFLDLLQAARVRTQRYSGSIKTQAENPDGLPVKAKMGYFFAILEDMLKR